MAAPAAVTLALTSRGISVERIQRPPYNRGEELHRWSRCSGNGIHPRYSCKGGSHRATLRRSPREASHVLGQVFQVPFGTRRRDRFRSALCGFPRNVGERRAGESVMLNLLTH